MGNSLGVWSRENKSDVLGVYFWSCVSLTFSTYFSPRAINHSVTDSTSSLVQLCTD